MPKLELTNEQLETIQTAWGIFVSDDDNADQFAENLEITTEERGLEDEEGNENDDYDEGSDVVFRRFGEVTLLLEAAKPD